ncbi:MAG: hypothetical protein EPO11_04420 [Gammaproteobacteria bacterium]|nr:MAG: hypothetical protein EPO11_04420 [Gammaproteobacteria bacterium]
MQAIIVFLFTLLFSLTSYADQLIIEPDMGREPLVQAIQHAHYSIKLVMYGFTDRQLLESLLEQKAKGRTVAILLEQTPYKAEDENIKTIETLKEHHINWQGSIPPLKLIHQKTLLIDDQEAIVMTLNFTHSAFKNDRNFALIIDDPKRVKEIDDTFSADWNHHAIHHTSSDVIWSPDNSRAQLMKLISQAHDTIDIYAQDLNDYRIIGSLAKAARKGVNVKIITSANLRAGKLNYLTRAGVKIHRNEQHYIHAKVFIIDQQKAVVGSINLTSASLDDNRELSVVTEDTNVIKQLLTVFDKDWTS